MANQLVSVKIVGKSPLLMHNVRLANPLDPFAKTLAALTKKRSKTEDDHLAIQKAEFFGGIYYDSGTSTSSGVGVYVAGEALEATFCNGGKKIKQGTAIKSGVQVNEFMVKLLYDGPRTPEELFEAGYYDVRAVSAQGRGGGGKTMRTRPAFSSWALGFTIAFESTVISEADLRESVKIAGDRVGLLDGRPRYGKFDIAEWKLL